MNLRLSEFVWIFFFVTVHFLLRINAYCDIIALKELKRQQRAFMKRESKYEEIVYFILN